MKNKKAILLLFLANAVSGIAQGISMIAIPWYFSQQGNMGIYGIAYAVITLISLFWGPLSGTIVDKYNRKNIFLSITTICGLFLMGIVGLGYVLGDLPYWAVLLVLAMTFFNYNIHYPTLYAFVQEITEKEQYAKVTSYIEIQGQLATVLAGAGGAILLEGIDNYQFANFIINIPAWSIHEIFLLDACTYFIGFCIISSIHYQPLVERSVENGSVLTRLKVGWDYLKSNRSLLLFGVASYSIFVTTLVTLFYLNAQYVKSHLESEGYIYAMSEMLFACGSILAGLSIRRIFKRVTIPMSVIIMTITVMCILIILFFTKSVYLFIGLCALYGLCNAGTRIQRITYLFQHVPNHVYGRTASIFFISNIIFRFFFINLFTLQFFHTSNNIIYAYGILAAFLLLTLFVLIWKYQYFLQKG